MALAIFFSIVGTVGLVGSAFALLVTGFDRDYVIPFSIIFGMSFLFAATGYKMQDEVPVKQVTAQQKAIDEYYRCIGTYNADWVVKNKKISEEQYCANLNVIYKKNVLGVK